MDKIAVGVIGAGYWGPNLVRNFTACPQTELVAVCDADPAKLEKLGDLYYVDSVRINLGLFQRDTNVIWDLAPHDLSIVDAVVGGTARSISAWGCSHGNPDIEDVAYVNVDFGERLLANFHVSWLSP